jgi:hypothetical protein
MSMKNLEASYRASIVEDGRALAYVPEGYKTAALCMAAVTQNREALEYVPERLKTAALCRATIEQDRRGQLMLLQE